MLSLQVMLLEMAVCYFYLFLTFVPFVLGTHDKVDSITYGRVVCYACHR